MADNKEFYRLDLVIGTDGVEEAERAVKAMDKLLQQTQRRAAALGKTKINPSASLKDKATASADKVTRTMNRVDRIVSKPEARLVDHVTSAAGKIGTTLTGLTRKTWRITVGVKNLALGALSGIKNSLFSLPSMLAAGGAAYGGVVAPLNLSGQMEQAGVAFETMLKSASKAQTFMDELKEFAERTPFDFAGVRDNAQRMLAFKWKQEDIIPDLTTIGDWAGSMGKGKEGIDRVVLAFGQMRAKGRIQGDEMLQLTEAGINAYDYLAKAIGVSTAAVMDLQSQGLLPAEQSIKAILKGMQQDFGGGMKKQEKTLLGLWNRMKEVFSNKLLFRWGEGIRLAVQPRLQKIGDWLDNNEKTIQHWGDMLQKTAKKATDWVADKFEKVWKLGDDPAFQNADFFGKVGIVWDTVIGQSFSDWMSSGGLNTLDNISSEIGSALGGGLKGFIMGALGIVSDKSSDESIYVSAGRTAGEAFFTSFLEALDPGEIVKKLGTVVLDKNTDVITEPSVGNTLEALATDAAVLAGGSWLFKRIGGKKVVDLVKSLFGVGGKAATTATTTAGSSVATSVATGAGAATVGTVIEGSAEGMSRVATYGTRASWLSSAGIYGIVAALAGMAGIGIGETMNQGLNRVNELRDQNKQQKMENYTSDFNPAETTDWSWVQNEPAKWYDFKRKFWEWVINTEIAGVDMTDVFGQPKVPTKLGDGSMYPVTASSRDILNGNVEPMYKIPPLTTEYLSPLKVGETQQFQLPEEQINQIVTPLNDLKKEITINVNMPPGLVNMTVQKDELDVDHVVNLTGQKLRDALRAAQQNLK